MPTYLVEAVQEGKTFSTDNGNFQSWKLQVHDGERSLEAEINTKLGKPGPTVGERFEATPTQTQFGVKLKRVFAPSNGAGRAPMSPAKEAEIRRLACQKSGVALLVAEVQLGKEKEGTVSELLKKRIDWLELDCIDAGKRAAS
jgi:hypothetical protein